MAKSWFRNISITHKPHGKFYLNFANRWPWRHITVLCCQFYSSLWFPLPMVYIKYFIETWWYMVFFKTVYVKNAWKSILTMSNSCLNIKTFWKECLQGHVSCWVTGSDPKRLFLRTCQPSVVDIYLRRHHCN
jgi:hypothetical protein